MTDRLDFRLLGVGAMNSPRFRPAGLLIGHGTERVMLDGGGDAVPDEPVEAWLVSDERAELMPAIRRGCRPLDLTPAVVPFRHPGMTIEPRPVVHTSHPAYGYLIVADDTRTAWAPEFWEFPDWAHGADLMFADAAGWRTPIRFARGVGGHAAVLDIAEQARRHEVRRLVFAHIGRPSIQRVPREVRAPAARHHRRDRIRCDASPA